MDATTEQIAEQGHCGPDLDPIVDSVRTAIDAGIDHVYFHQIGDLLDGFVDMFRDKRRPELP